MKSERSGTGEIEKELGVCKLMKWAMPPNTEDVGESFSSTVWEFLQLSKNQVYQQ